MPTMDQDGLPKSLISTDCSRLSRLYSCMGLLGLCSVSIGRIENASSWERALPVIHMGTDTESPLATRQGKFILLHD